MKVVTAVILLLAEKFYCTTSLEPQGISTNIECSSSGKTCLKPYCHLKRIELSNDLITFGCDLQRKLSPVFVRFLIAFNCLHCLKYCWLPQFKIQFIELENAENHLISERTVNLCDVIEEVKTHNNVDRAIFMELIFVDLIQPCPYSQIKVINSSRLHFNHSLPNGIYKTVTTIMDDDDDKIFEVIYFEEIKSWNDFWFHSLHLLWTGLITK